MKQLLIISCLILTTFTVMAATAAASPKSWFREKYIEYYHDEYYDYYMSQYQLAVNDGVVDIDRNKRDICVDFHKPATLFAITGQRQPAPATRKSIQRTCPLTIYATTAKYTDYLPPEEYYPRFIRFAIEDVIEPLGNFMCDVFEVYMMLMSIILASISSVFIIMLIFCQY
jgi:hypothetical protein